MHDEVVFAFEGGLVKSQLRRRLRKTWRREGEWVREEGDCDLEALGP